MVSYVENVTIKMPNIKVRSVFDVSLNYTETESSHFKMKSISAHSTLEFESGEVPALTVTALDDFHLKLTFNQLMQKAKFILNDIEISEMSITEHECIYYLNPAMLNIGENFLRIIVVDSEDIEHLKTFKVSKDLTTNSIKNNATIHIKGKKYQVISNNGDSVTLDSALLSDVPVSSFVEAPSFTTIPYASLSFYNEATTMLPMEFVKSVFVDGKVEEMYEVRNGIGDILHTKVEAIRDDSGKSVNINNVQFALQPDEV